VDECLAREIEACVQWSRCVRRALRQAITPAICVGTYSSNHGDKGPTASREPSSGSERGLRFGREMAVHRDRPQVCGELVVACPEWLQELTLRLERLLRRRTQIWQPRLMDDASELLRVSLDEEL